MPTQSTINRRDVIATLAMGALVLTPPPAWPQDAPSAARAGSLTVGDLTVHRLGFGAMRITGDGIMGPPKDPAAAKAVLHRALELGVNFIDTADAYGPDVSEQLICETLHPYPAGLVIATKGGYTRPNGDWVPDGTPAHLRAACEASLRRLRTDRIDVYQLHRPDPKVPLAESVGALVDLQKKGKIRHIGLSNVSLAQLKAAQQQATIVSVQNRYNLGDRSSEDVLQYCAQNRLAFLPWAPLGGRSDPPALARIAQARGADAQRVALAWLLARSPAMLPIPGTSNIQHLEDNLAAASLHLSDQELKQLG